MKNIGLRSIMILREDEEIRVTDALCRHMAWPLAYGGKVKDGCITCPLHQTKYDLDSGLRDALKWYKANKDQFNPNSRP